MIIVDFSYQLNPVGQDVFWDLMFSLFFLKTITYVICCSSITYCSIA